MAQQRELTARRCQPGVLIHALAKLAVAGTLVDRQATQHGIKYVVDGHLDGGRRTDRVRTVWLADTPEDPPRLITAYPAPRGG
jgi:hypothetical protein